MRNFDLTPLYRASVGFDRLADMMDRALAENAVIVAQMEPLFPDQD